ncbi:LLM class flavin-dependent oxidoreductase [Streptacidiphilus carbonis]|jgi:5,10-methylenetetrahydromethanopterin reductase|uniref:LLM class flavin-dependent oxidoreductase n=1 Tax=Streptacidiphilus carbonis TaxID=105422 RepID=UPI0005A94AB2|nr:LLM class flavin-dependent oxidoreductase [Streptacidiphilus carbonis]
MTTHRIGVMYDRDWAPEGLLPFARDVEALGVDDLWVVEDLGWTGSIASASAALAVTERLRVGIGITPAPLRSPALLAMELAAVARMFPGRLTAGVGHGVREWMEQVGVAPRSPLALLEETLQAVQGLLRGEEVTVRGREVSLDGVRLVHPPAVLPQLLAGVVRPRSLELAGRVADGAIIAEGHGPDDLSAAMQHMLKARDAKAARPNLTVFAFLCVDDDPQRLRGTVGPALDGHAAWLGRAPEDVFAAAGPAPTAATRVRELWAAGADTVVLRAVGPEPFRQIEAAVRELRG